MFPPQPYSQEALVPPNVHGMRASPSPYTWQCVAAPAGDERPSPEALFQ